MGNEDQESVGGGKNSQADRASSPHSALESVAIEQSHCSLCRSVMEGGLWTNGDGYGDSKYVGITPPEFDGYCWNCVKTRNSEIPHLDAQINAAFVERGLCGFLEAWVGRCRNASPCSKHVSQACSSCGARATHSCAETGQFVCGSPLCDDCEHTIFPSGTNGGIGFNTQELPEGMKSHCRKTEQKFKPWYEWDTQDTASASAPSQ